MEKLAPIVLFVYNRLWHTKQTVEALKKNTLALQSKLIVFSDAPKTKEQKQSVDEVREYIKTIDGFKTINLIRREKNYGLAKSFIEGTTEIVNKYGMMIGVEDDNVTSKFFLEYMNWALKTYEKEKRVMCISGFCPPIKNNLPETFFLRGADSWSFAIWRRSWNLIEWDPIKLLEQIEKMRLEKYMKKDAMTDYHKLLKEYIAGEHDSWSSRFYTSVIINNGFTLFPKRPLTKNIGMDNTGVHCNGLDPKVQELYDSDIAYNKVKMKKHENFVHNNEALAFFKAFFRKTKGSIFLRAKGKLRYYINRIWKNG